MLQYFLKKHKGKVQAYKLNYLLTYLQKVGLQSQIVLFYPELPVILEEQHLDLEALAMVFNTLSKVSLNQAALLKGHQKSHSLLMHLIDSTLNKKYLSSKIEEKFLQVLFESYMINYALLHESSFFHLLSTRICQ